MRIVNRGSGAPATVAPDETLVQLAGRARAVGFEIKADDMGGADGRVDHDRQLILVDGGRRDVEDEIERLLRVVGA
jgi:hypothetical protein